jgi:hypothetical protein
MSLPYILQWNVMGRKGQSCEMLPGKGSFIQVRFEDGFTAVLDRRAVRRRRDAQIKKLEPQKDKNTIAAMHPTRTGE